MKRTLVVCSCGLLAAGAQAGKRPMTSDEFMGLRSLGGFH